MLLEASSEYSDMFGIVSSGTLYHCSEWPRRTHDILFSFLLSKKRHGKETVHVLPDSFGWFRPPILSYAGVHATSDK